MKKFIQNLKAKNLKKTAGFTLIEILVVIGIIAILAAIVIIAINPAKQFAQARNTQRQAGVNAILNAVGQRIADNKGVFGGTFTIAGTTYTCSPLAVSTASTSITTTMSNTVGDLGCLVPTYIASLPSDPAGVTAPATGFDISVDAAGRIMVCADAAKNETSLPSPAGICVIR